MIHRIEDYNLTLSTPDLGGEEKEAHYESLSARVIFHQSDADEVRRQLLLILKCKEKSLVVIFTPRRGKEKK